jgi:flagellar motor switch protein FliM
MESLKQKNLLNVMAKMRSLVSSEEVIPECCEVDWTVPRHFNAETLDRLTEIGNKFAIFLESTLQDLCGEDFHAKFDGVSECFAGVLLEQVNQEHPGHYFLPITFADRGDVGFIGLSLETCAVLIGQVLCDPTAEIGQEGKLSGLEESILQDSVFSITDTLLRGFSEYGQIKIQKGKQLVQGQWPVSFNGLQEMSKLSFEAQCDSIQFDLSMYLLDEIIDSMLGIPAPKRSSDQSNALAGRITEQLKDIATDVSVRLKPSMITLKNILTLEKDDVVLLDHKIASPANVLVNEQFSFKAWPAKSAGHCAVVIAEKQSDESY